ncbi:MAG: exonuclease SbcCD subunit D [Candidatus Lokiarchaeota archaeon]
MRIAHISDTHLGYRQYNLDVREQDIYDVFNEAIDIALEERADVLIHSGDLFDTPEPPIKALYTLQNALSKIGDKMKVLTVLGEHDTPKRRGMAPHRLFKMEVLGDAYSLDHVIIDDVLFAGISNLKGRATDHLKQELEKFDFLTKQYEGSVLILHQAIKSFLPFEGAYQLKEDDLPQSANYYALGHIHSREIQSFGNGKLAYAGSTEIMNKDEISSWKKNGKGLYLIDIEKGDVSVERIDLNVRPQIKLEIEERELEKTLKELSFEPKPILHLEIIGEMMDKSGIYEKLQELLEDKVISYRPIFRDTTVKDLTIPKGPINFQEILREYFADNNVADFAYDLYKNLSIDEIEESIDLANKRMEEDDLQIDN